MQDYRKLVVWQRAHRMVLDGYACSQHFPTEERFGLTSQLRRALVSVAANLAEGRSRSSERAFASFVDIAGGSAAESDYLLLLAHDLGYLSAEDHARLGESSSDVRRMLSALRRAFADRVDRRRSGHRPPCLDANG